MFYLRKRILYIFSLDVTSPRQSDKNVWLPMFSDFFFRLRSKVRVGSQKNLPVWSLTILGGGFAETIPLIVKYIYKGNIHYLVENNC